MGESFKEAPPGNPNIIYVLTQIASSDDVATPAVQLRKDGIKVIGFGIGDKADSKQLTLMSHSASMMFMAKKEGIVKSLASCQSRTARSKWCIYS